MGAPQASTSCGSDDDESGPARLLRLRLVVAVLLSFLQPPPHRREPAEGAEQLAAACRQLMAHELERAKLTDLLDGDG